MFLNRAFMRFSALLCFKDGMRSDLPLEVPRQRDVGRIRVVHAAVGFSRRQLRRRLKAMAVSLTCRPALAKPSQRIRRRP